jgi:alpha-L-fucosidase
MQTIADGMGKWWEGMDPQMINGKPHAKGSPCPEFVQQFLLRVQDVIDSYNPDILNFDDGARFDFDAGGPGAPDLKVWLGIPDLAPQIIAYYYNKNVQSHGGHLEGVVDLKEVPEPVWGTLTRDLEGAFADKLQKDPWQTEACIGHWHYDRKVFENHTYQKASLMVPLLVDIVSKNGNLLLSIPLPGYGEPDSDEIAFLGELSDWQKVNSEAINGSRPWKIYGEGPSTQAKALPAYQFQKLRFDSTDIRFTTKGETLYAIALGWPADGKILVKSLAQNSENYPGQIGSVQLLGSNSALKWARGTEGLQIELPDRPPCKNAFSFRILPG